MSVIPDEWGEPGSRAGFYHDVLWATLAVVFAGALVYWEPFWLDVELTATRVLGAAALGCGLSVALTCVTLVSERCRRVWQDTRVRFVGIFLIAMLAQAGLALAPTWTLLTMLATFLTVIPLRTYAYVRTK